MKYLKIISIILYYSIVMTMFKNNTFIFSHYDKKDVYLTFFDMPFVLNLTTIIVFTLMIFPIDVLIVARILEKDKKI
jgi:hypothetical protein